jgi:transcriptional regulator with XRE-family HTH domain
MLSNKQREFMDTLRDREYRRAFADEIATSLAFQIRRLREARQWSQEDLAEKTEKKQPTISQWEDPNYGRYSLKTLKELAAAFDVALLVRFAAFSELADWTVDVPPSRLTPPSYEEERQSALTDMSIRFGQVAGTTIDTAEFVASYEGKPGTATSGFVPPGGGELFEEQRPRERELAKA